MSPRIDSVSLEFAWRVRGHPPAEDEMNADYIVTGIIALLLFGYLIVALLKPERF